MDVGGPKVLTLTDTQKKLVGGWTNPFEKYVSSQLGNHETPTFVVKIPPKKKSSKPPPRFFLVNSSVTHTRWAPIFF